ncbi:polyisoprenoid-binding protein [Flavilitoribacter nigricans DSM 23189 = NBRC 102662]|uniref:Polyisoprenoid-binding protein n=2 Tax=Flavilitoribacter TaxID=2762562 RepID=A0A2D0NED6_FLAN2|nr:polyisoprenoid-binding protein [Flavilitoribacter nigricans DSM 23189 = NBRC 102662]
MFVVLLAAAGFLSAFTVVEYTAVAPTWQVDKGHSSVAFSVRHFFASVIGTFDEFDGTVTFDPEDLEGSSIDFSIKVASVNTKNERRDNHLQSADFFNAEEWPEMTFKSSNITKSGDQYLAKGEMTIRDVTKEVEIPIQFLGQMEHPRRAGSYIGGFATEFTIDRNEYGVGTGNYAATATIGGEVKVTINLEVNRSDS